LPLVTLTRCTARSGASSTINVLTQGGAAAVADQPYYLLVGFGSANFAPIRLSHLPP